MTSSSVSDGVPAALAEKLAGLKPIAGPGGLGLQDPNLRSLRPYELSATLRSDVERLSLQQNLEEMKEKGYTVLTDCFSAEECDRLVAAVHRVGQGNRLLFKDGEEAFSAVAVHEKMYTLAEYMVGTGCQLSQFAASVLQQEEGARGMPKTGLHADQNWTPAPFPEHNQLFTCCVVLSDGFTLETGATCVVPGSHRLRRHPNLAEQQHCAELVEPIHAKRGDVACWDGSVWHAPGVRQVPGERVVLHVTYSRVFMTPLESYDDIPDSVIDAQPNPPLLRRLIGRGPEMQGMFNLKKTGRDMLQFLRLTEMARGTYDTPAFQGKLEAAKKVMEEYMEEYRRKQKKVGGGDAARAKL